MANEQVLAKALIEIGTSGIPDAEAHLRSLEADLRTVGRSYSEGTVEIGEYTKQHARLSAEIETFRKGIAAAKDMTEAQTAKVVPLTKEVYDLADAYDLAEENIKDATTTQTVYASAADKSAASARRLADSQEQVTSQGGNLAKSGKNTGMAFLELSRAFEDAQYGLRGVLNNIPTTIQMFGGSAGLAAGVSVAAVSFSILEPYITQFIADMGVFGEKTSKATDEIGRLQERISELESKPVKLAVDMLDLEQAKKKIEELQKAQAAFKAAGEGKTVFEKEAGDQFKANFEQSGQEGKEARDAIKRQIAQELIANSPEIAAAEQARVRAEAAVKSAESRIAHATSAGAVQQALQAVESAKADVKKAQDEAAKERREILQEGGKAERQTGAIFDGAFAGNDAESRRRLAQRFRGVGAGSLARGLEASTPEEMQRQSEEEAEFEHNAQNAKTAREARQRREKKRVEKANEAAAAMEHDPRVQDDLKRNRERFGGLGREGVTVDDAAANVRALEKDREKPQELPEIPPANVRHKNERAFAEEGLARQIFAGSQQATGVQFSPDQARAAAKATGDLVGRNVNFNVALQSALAEQVQAMSAMGNQLMSQASQMQQIRMEFQMVRRGIQTRQRTAGKRGG